MLQQQLVKVATSGPCYPLSYDDRHKAYSYDSHLSDMHANRFELHSLEVLLNIPKSAPQCCSASSGEVEVVHKAMRI